MSVHALKIVVGRDQIVAEQVRFFMREMRNQFEGPKGIELIEDFATNAERIAHLHSQEATAAIKDDEDRLTRHADHMRMVAAQVVLLRNGFVPALKIYPDSQTLRLQALGAIAFIKGHFFAMETGNY